jgi:transcriptional regulator with XRE-family HTH domain
MTAEIIKAVLKAHRITQREVAARIGITPQALYERISVAKITCETIEMIASAIGISPAVFYGEQERQELLLLRQLLAEKERTIQILIGQKVE